MGLSKRAIKLGKLLEGYLDYTVNDTMDLDTQDSPDGAAVGLLDAAQDIWDIVLKTEEGARAVLKDRHRLAKEKKKGKDSSGRHKSYSSSSSSDASSSSSDSSLDSSDQGRAPAPPNRPRQPRNTIKLLRPPGLQQAHWPPCGSKGSPTFTSGTRVTSSTAPSRPKRPTRCVDTRTGIGKG